MPDVPDQYYIILYKNHTDRMNPLRIALSEKAAANDPFSS